eukprot:CAMPEP_0176478496 /NCGR_PEP_ID=MMETSP0200_2-20121128/1218_1 /TAXON_ID=947934 /ORGANISM="Chaetoceros sp., Strain GSL56" /LENGTH=533 /DNA_ID=CAMNT_0017874439 /DNA_START=33 /DNA_END=1634 /DNA_ORIENTATION=+
MEGETNKKSLFKKPKAKVKKQFTRRIITNLDDGDDGEEEHHKSSTGSGSISISSNISGNDPTHPLSTGTNHDTATTTIMSSGEEVTQSSSTSTSILDKIEYIKKSRKIKDQIRTRGLGAGLIDANHGLPLKKIKGFKRNGDGGGIELSSADIEVNAETIANQDLKKRLEGNFAIKGCNTNEEDGNVLMRKHKVAMEEFIEQQIKVKDNNANGDNNAQQQQQQQQQGGADNDDDNALLQVKNSNDLYTKILQDAKQQLSSNDGKNTAAVAAAIGDGSTMTMEDSDIGAGGAMLGGTGIAEVALPVEERIKAARQTELAAARMEHKRMMKRRHGYSNNNKNYKGGLDDDILEGKDGMDTSYEMMLPISFGVGPGKQRRKNLNANVKLQPQEHELPSSLLQADSSRRDVVLGRVLNKNSMPGIGSSYSHNFRLHNDEWIQKQKQQQQQQLQEEEDEQDKRIVPLEGQGEAVVDDSNRIGFEARKRLQDHPRSKGARDGGAGAGSGSGAGGKRKMERAHDDMVYKKFVSREIQNKRR